MSDTSRRRARAVQRSASFTLSVSLALLATATLAHAAPQTKTCAQISGCATSVSSPPPLPMATLGGTEPPASHLAVRVATAPTSSAKARGQSGTLVTGAARGRRIRCGGYRLTAPTTFHFELQPTTSASGGPSATGAPPATGSPPATGPSFTGASSASGAFTTKLYITYEITERITNAAADGVQFCLAAEFGFKTMSGRPAPARPLPDGTRGHVGLLPPCPTPLPPPGLTKAPCLEPITTVNDSNSSTGVDVILKARIPTLIVGTVTGAGDSSNGDPWGGG